jgi:mRNA-degrading endonuclease RelE of RelBE toxin-antitoxin system
MKRRPVNIIGLSFLDVMFCGFGSVILLVMIVNADTITRRKEVHDDRRGEVVRLERQVLEGEKYLVELRNSLQESQQKQVVARGLSERVLALTRQTREELADLDKETLAKIAHINALKADLKSLDEDTKRLRAESQRQEEQGRQVRQFLGEGDRQYLTGLKVGGSRILFLVDASASMLDETIVNVIRRRNMGDAEKRRSAKWRRAIATVEWLVSQLPATSSYQIYAFNTQARPLLPATAGRWLPASDADTLDQAIAALHALVPERGTSLGNALAVVNAIKPRPDNIMLLTDGLPTQGRSAPPANTKVSARKRLQLFQDAIAALPEGVPVNTILYPMEGDPMAASAFWKLATYTRGSFISPSKDWP